MSHYKENTSQKILKHIYCSYIPNKKDNLKQIIIKIVFLLSLLLFIISSCFIISYFSVAEKQKNVLSDAQKIWYQTKIPSTEEVTEEAKSPQEILLEQNSDFKGWISINGTNINNPIYQTDNNDFYLNHNNLKKNSTYGSLFFDFENTITENKTDKNLVIYGHNMKNGSMFGELKKFKNLDFYKEHPTINFSTLYDNSTYKIYAIFLLNAYKADDNNYIYNIFRKDFINSSDFSVWVKEACDRSIIDTKVDVEYGDDILTLVTCSNDFTNARLVVMARKTRQDESPKVETYNAKTNKNPRYPKLWYDERNIKFPF